MIVKWTQRSCFRRIRRNPPGTKLRWRCSTPEHWKGGGCHLAGVIRHTCLERGAKRRSGKAEIIRARGSSNTRGGSARFQDFVTGCLHHTATELKVSPKEGRIKQLLCYDYVNSLCSASQVPQMSIRGQRWSVIPLVLPTWRSCSKEKKNFKPLKVRSFICLLDGQQVLKFGMLMMLIEWHIHLCTNTWNLVILAVHHKPDSRWHCTGSGHTIFSLLLLIYKETQFSIETY